MLDDNASWALNQCELVLWSTRFRLVFGLSSNNACLIWFFLGEFNWMDFNGEDTEEVFLTGDPLSGDWVTFLMDFNGEVTEEFFLVGDPFTGDWATFLMHFNGEDTEEFFLIGDPFTGDWDTFLRDESGIFGLEFLVEFCFLTSVLGVKISSWITFFFGVDNELDLRLFLCGKFIATEELITGAIFLEILWISLQINAESFKCLSATKRRCQMSKSSAKKGKHWIDSPIYYNLLL